jgi:hypothetical protein
MKANELRLGNLILKNNEIHEISSLFFVDLHDGTIRENYNNSYIIEPIPLTEEWLLKFGFKKNEIPTALKEFYIVNYQLENFVVYLLEKSFEIELINKNKDQFNLFINPKKQVHILQNLYFALTNNELKIK